MLIADLDEAVEASWKGAIIEVSLPVVEIPESLPKAEKGKGVAVSKSSRSVKDFGEIDVAEATRRFVRRKARHTRQLSSASDDFFAEVSAPPEGLDPPFSARGSGGVPPQGSK